MHTIISNVVSHRFREPIDEMLNLPKRIEDDCVLQEFLEQPRGEDSDDHVL
jgi:hypothetical protein